MRTLHSHSVDDGLVHRMMNLVGKANAYCTRRCGKWGSPTCFSCLFRDVRQLHKEIVNGSVNDGQGGGVKADAVQLVRTEDARPREDSQPRGQVNASHLHETLEPDGVKATGLGLVGSRRIPEVGQEGVP